VSIAHSRLTVKFFSPAPSDERGFAFSACGNPESSQSLY